MKCNVPGLGCLPWMERPWEVMERLTEIYSLHVTARTENSCDFNSVSQGLSVILVCRTVCFVLLTVGR